MAVFRDLDPCTYFGGGPAAVLRSVGWIGASAFPTGRTDPEVYHRLVALLKDPYQPVALLGFHRCEACQFAGEKSGSSNLFVPGDDVVYVCPELIVHYINAHHYAPPAVFSEAVLRCPDTRSTAYQEILLAAGGRALTASWASSSP